MLSLQRRLERYRIIYTWKVIEGLVPNCGVYIKEGSDVDRLGRKCSIPNMKTSAKLSVQSLREQSFQINGAQLFNCLPIYVRNMRNCSILDFKMKLDKYLETIPDEPQTNSMIPSACDNMARPSNSVLHQSRTSHVKTTVDSI